MKVKTCMKKVFFFVLCLTFACTLSGATIYDRSEILKIMKKTANHTRYTYNDWLDATYYTGIVAAYKVSLDTAYLNQAESWGQSHRWLREGESTSMDAGNTFCGLPYVELFLLDSIAANQNKIADMNGLYDQYCAVNASGCVVWTWCDILFGVPSIMVRLAHIKGWGTAYDKFNTWWWDVHTCLYDTTEHLFYRDNGYFYSTTASGKKVFWSRGNGWVTAGTALVLQYIPDDYPDRTRYEQLLREMCEALAAKQGSDGLWRSSLLDSAQYPSPETSGSAFFCYAMAWGINNGILDAVTYLPVVKKAWEGLVSKVDANGKLGYVQTVAAEPGETFPEDTRSYAVGGFLLAGSEMWKGCWGDSTPPTDVTVNSTSVKDQTIALSWNAATDAESGISNYQIYRDTTANPTDLYVTVGGNVLTYQDETGIENKTFHYRVKAMNGAGLTSSNFSNDVSAATAQDTVKPSVIAIQSLSAATVKITFSEKVEQTTAEDIGNYIISNCVSVTGAARQTNQRSVVLSVSTLQTGTAYSFHITGIRDLASIPNTMSNFDTAIYIIRTPVIRNSSFESPLISTYQYGVTDSFWTFGGVTGNGSGIEHNGSDFSAANAPDGVQAAFLHGLGTVSQNVYFDTGYYRIRFSAAQRQENNQTIRVTLDEMEIGLFTPSSGNFVECVTDSVLVLSGTHLLKFAGTNSTGDNTAFIDAVSVVVPGGTDNEPGVMKPENLVLCASPNPFNPSAQISWYLPQKAVVSLALYSLQGKLVRELVGGMVSGGKAYCAG